MVNPFDLNTLTLLLIACYLARVAWRRAHE
jgi:hypothetical protein